MENAVPVLHKFFNTDVGQGVTQHLHDYLVRNSGNVRTILGGVGYVLRTADAGGNNFGGNAVDLKNGGNVLNHGNAVVGNVVQSADKGADVGGACLCGKQSLCRAEDQGHVGLNALGGKNLYCLQAFLGYGDLDNDVLMDLGKLACFLYHACGVGG